jgi:cAMP-dependent protein kinase regulator
MGGGSKPEGFKNLLNKWQQADDKCGSAPFAVAAPKEKKSTMAMQNEASIKEYKKSFKDKKFKVKIPTRGRSVWEKPAQLQNVFGAKPQQDLTKYKPPVFNKSDAEVAIIQETVKKNFFFDDMTSTELTAFIDAFEPFQVAKGANIITQGEDGDYFYILGEGKVTFLVQGNDVGNAELGASFGELALLYACPRAASVRAEAEPTKLFRVDQMTFRSLLQKQTKIMEAEKEQLLRSINFLSEIDESDMKCLGRAMAPKIVEAGDSLVRKGEEGDAFYIIQEGEMTVTDISVGPAKFEDIMLKAGDYFGERALATHEPRAANVTATTKGTAFSIDRTTFEKVLGKFSRVIMKSQDRRCLVSSPCWFEEYAVCVGLLKSSQFLFAGGNRSIAVPCVGEKAIRGIVASRC